MIHISVVIPSYNSQDHLKGVMEGLASQTFDGEFEVVVVDCSNTDEPRRIAGKYDFVRFEHVDKRFSPGVGRNIGAELARGKLLTFVDSDVVLLPGALETAWQFYSIGNLVFGGALELNERVPTTVASYFEHFYYNHECQKGRPISSRNNLSSALMFIDKALFIEQGGFKDIPRVQDTEFTERLVTNGYQLLFNPAAVGLQIQDSPLRKVFRKIFISGRNLYFIRYQNKGLVKKIVFFLLLPLLAILKVFRIIARHLTYQNTRNRLITLLLTPLFAMAGVFWMCGLYQSVLFGGGISSRRD